MRARALYVCVFLALWLAPAAASQTFWVGDTWEHDHAPRESIASHGWGLQDAPPEQGIVNTPPNGFLHWQIPTWLTLRAPPEAHVVLQCREGLWGVPALDAVQGDSAHASLFWYGPDDETLLAGRGSASGRVCSDGSPPSTFDFLLDERMGAPQHIPPGSGRLRLGTPFESHGEADLNGSLIVIGEEGSYISLDARTGRHVPPVGFHEQWVRSTGELHHDLPVPGDVADWNVSVSLRGGWMDVVLSLGDDVILARNLTAGETQTTISWARRDLTPTDTMDLWLRMDAEEASIVWDVQTYWDGWTPETIRAWQDPLPIPVAPPVDDARLYVVPHPDGGLALDAQPATGTTPAPWPVMAVAWDGVERTVWDAARIHLVFRCPEDGTVDAIQDIPLAYHRSWSSHLNVSGEYVQGATVPMEPKTCEAGEHLPFDLTMATDGLRLPANGTIFELGIFHYIAHGGTSPGQLALELVHEQSWIDVKASPGHHWQSRSFMARDGRGVISIDAPAASFQVVSPQAGTVRFEDGLRTVWTVAVEPHVPVTSTFRLAGDERWEFTGPRGTVVEVQGFVPAGPGSGSSGEHARQAPVALVVGVLALAATVAVKRPRQ